MEAARQLHPAKVWEDMSPKLYTTFWSLCLYDLYVPTGRYEDEIRKAHEAIKELEDKIDIVRVALASDFFVYFLSTSLSPTPSPFFFSYCFSPSPSPSHLSSHSLTLSLSLSLLHSRPVSVRRSRSAAQL